MTKWFLLVTVAVVGSLLLVHFGVFGGRRRPTAPGRFAGAVLVVLGAASVLAS